MPTKLAAGGSVKVVSLIRFNCLHYCSKETAFAAHYDFKEARINMNEPRQMKMRADKAGFGLNGKSGSFVALSG